MKWKNVEKNFFKDVQLLSCYFYRGIIAQAEGCDKSIRVVVLNLWFHKTFSFGGEWNFVSSGRGMPCFLLKISSPNARIQKSKNITQEEAI